MPQVEWVLDEEREVDIRHDNGTTETLTVKKGDVIEVPEKDAKSLKDQGLAKASAKKGSERP